MKETLFIYVNPAFDEKYQCGISRLYRVLAQKYGFNLEIIDTEFLREHVPPGSGQILVIAGGDGTIHRVLNTIPPENIEKYTFGIIPGGTANEFARSLSLPLVLEEAAGIIARRKCIFKGKLGIINNKYRFVTGFLYGIACKVLQETPQTAKHYFGEYAYQLPGFFSIGEYHDFVKKFRIDRTEFKTGYLLINIASLSSKNIAIIDENEGYSVIYLTSGLTTGDFARLIFKNHANTNILDDPAVKYLKMEDLTLEFEGHIDFMLDGEVYNSFDPPIRFSRFPHGVNVII